MATPLNLSMAFEERFGRDQYDEAECLAAIRGQAIPRSLGCWVTRLCLLRGIRYHPTFGGELRDALDHPEFIRALNARDIMSNLIPVIVAEEHFPYCIWHPQVATEQTYRSLARRYPQMRYQVGRACAVAGYAQLYRELGLLPDISIAEEARDSMSEGSAEIFNLITQQPQRWSIMDDYRRTARLPDQSLPAPHGLNGDTAVRSTLELKRKFKEPSKCSRFGEDETGIYFDITEDLNIDEFDSVLPRVRPDSSSQPLLNTTEMVNLLWNPLPRDLPPGNKDILIFLAAYHGNIDRYERLRRPGITLEGESNCIIRGIYHNPLFARWWATRPASNSARYQAAINARFIMSNDLSRITPVTDRSCLPKMIHYPALAHERTYAELARRRPDMHTAVAKACVAANNPRLWDKLDMDLKDEDLWQAACASNNSHYLHDMRRRAEERGTRTPAFVGPKYCVLARQGLSEPSATMLRSGLPSTEHVRWDQEGPYNGAEANASAVELWVCAPEELRPAEEFYYVELARLYDEMGHVPPVPRAESCAYARRRA